MRSSVVSTKLSNVLRREVICTGMYQLMLLIEEIACRSKLFKFKVSIMLAQSLVETPNFACADSNANYLNQRPET